MIAHKESLYPLLLFTLIWFCRGYAIAADEKALQLAKKEGQVSFYTTMAATESKLLADAFQAKYPFMRVDITRQQRQAAPENRRRNIAPALIFSMWSAIAAWRFIY